MELLYCALHSFYTWPYNQKRETAAVCRTTDLKLSSVYNDNSL